VNWLKAFVLSKVTRLEQGGWIPKSRILKLLTVFVSLLLMLICPGSLFLVVIVTYASKMLYACKMCAIHMMGRYANDRQPRAKDQEGKGPGSI
jgi:hypothetical protein